MYRRHQLARAAFWTRAWARALDVCLAVFLANILALFLPSPTWGVEGVAAMLADKLVCAGLSGATIIAYDWVLLPQWGTTLGKALFGLSVQTPEGARITAAAARQRATTMFVHGLWLMLGFPYVQLVAAWTLSKKSALPWDFTGRGVVYQRTVGSTRRAVGFCLTALLVLAMVVGQRVAREEAREQLRQELRR